MDLSIMWLFVSKLYHKLNDMSEINGKADIIRWELLYEYGGVFVDADAYCIKSVAPLLKNNKSFVGRTSGCAYCVMALIVYLAFV